MTRSQKRGTKTAALTEPQADSRAVSRRVFVLIFAVALVYRALYLVEASQFPDFSLFYMDQEYHLEWAKAIASGVWNAPYDVIRDGAFFRAPLYPHFLAGIFALSGPNPLAARVVQMIMGSLSCSLVYALGTKLLGHRVGTVAGLLCALYWVLAYFDGELLMPVLIVFLGSLALLLLFMAAERRSAFLAALAGLSLGLFAIARPNILAFLPFAGVWLARAVRRDARRTRVVLVAVFTVLAVLPPVAVTLRNRAVSGDWVVVASQGGVNFYIGNNPDSDGMQAVVPGTRGTWWGGYEDAVETAQKDAGRSLRASEVSGYWLRRAFAYMREDTSGWMRLTGRKALAHISDVELPNNEPYEARRGRYVSLRAVPLSFAPLFTLFLVAVPGLFRFGHQRARLGRDGRALRQSFARLLLTFVLVYSLTVIAFFVTGRYRVPLVPVLAIGAASSLVVLFDALRARDLRRFGVMLMVAAALTGLLKVDWFGIRESTRGFARLSEAQDMLDTGDLNGAIESLTSIISDSEVDAPEVHVSLLRALAARGDPGDIGTILVVAEDGLSRHPDNADLLWSAAARRFERREWDAASRHLERYLVARPDDSRALFLAAASAHSQGLLAEADEYLSRAEALDPDDPLAAGLRALLDAELR